MILQINHFLDYIKDECVREALVENKGVNTKLLNFEVKSINERENKFHSDVVRIVAKYEADGEIHKTSYLLKIDVSRFHHGIQDNSSEKVQKEANFYMYLLNDLNNMLIKNGESSLAFQECYHVNNEKDKEFLILEDFHGRGFKLCDEKGTVDVHHATLILKELGRLHAAAILLQKEQPLIDLRVKYKCLKYMKDKEYIDMFVGNSLPYAANLLEKIGGYERTKKWLDLTRTNIYDFHIRTLTHAELNCQNEYWSNNVAFRYDSEGLPVEAMFIDVLINRTLSIDAALKFFLSFQDLTPFQDITPETVLATYLNSLQTTLQSGTESRRLRVASLPSQTNSSEDLHESMTVVNLLMQSNIYTSITEYKECIKEIFSKFK